jgi:hypothetical protein
VVEVTSPDTWKNDVGPKGKHYHRAKVPLDLIADATEHDEKRHLELIGYQYAPRRYKQMATDAQGRIYLQAVRLWIGVTRDRPGGLERLMCFDSETGEELGDHTTMREAKARAEARIRELRAELKRSRSHRPRSQWTRPNGHRSNSKEMAEVTSSARCHSVTDKKVVPVIGLSRR